MRGEHLSKEQLSRQIASICKLIKDSYYVNKLFIQYRYLTTEHYKSYTIHLDKNNLDDSPESIFTLIK